MEAEVMAGSRSGVEKTWVENCVIYCLTVPPCFIFLDPLGSNIRSQVHVNLLCSLLSIGSLSET